MIIGIFVVIMIAAYTAYFSLLLIGNVGDFNPPSGIAPRLAYYLVSAVAGSTPIGCLLLLLPSLGLIKVGVFQRPCPKVVILVLIIWVAIVWGGWRWAYSVDNYVGNFFEEGSVLAEIANSDLGFPQDDPIPDLSDNIWQIRSINYGDNQYCAQLQYYTWMRIPTHNWTSCFGIILHDALFMPSVIGAGVGADETNGFGRSQFRFFIIPEQNISGIGVEIQGLKWEDSALTLTLNPYFPLTGLVLEFIDDRDIILTLFPSDAATDSEAGTLTWAVPEPPWQDGDSLTFRIRAQRLPGDPAGP